MNEAVTNDTGYGDAGDHGRSSIGSLSVHSQVQERRSLIALGVTLALLASVYPLLAGSTYKGTAELHATIEMTGAVIAFIAGLSLIVRFYVLGNRFHLLVGLAFFVNGAEDLVHGFLCFAGTLGWTGLSQSPLARFIPGTYVTGRLLMAVLLMLAAFIPTRLGSARNSKRETIWISLMVLAVSALGTAVAFQVPLPNFIYPDQLISRPVDLISALLFCVALVLFVRKYHATRDMMTWWVSLAIGINVVGQAMMAFSKELYDPFFDIAHVYKVLGYAAPLLGFSLYQIATLVESKRAERELQEHRERLEKIVTERSAGLTSTNRKLEEEITERKRAEEELGRHRQHLAQLVAERTAELARANDELQEQIAERKRAQDGLQEERNKLKAVVDAIEYGLTIQDQDYNIVYQNKFLREIFGDTVGQKCYRTYESQDSVCGGCPVKKAYGDGKSYTTERRLIMPSGEVGFWENTANPIRDARGKVVACLEITRNVTARKQVEEELKAHRDHLERLVEARTADLSKANEELRDTVAERKRAEAVLRKNEQKYRTLVESLPQRMFFKNADSVYLSCNKNYAKDLKIQPDRITGKSDFDFFAKDLAEEYRADDREVLASRKVKDIEERYVCDGKEAWVHTVKAPVEDEDGNLIGLIGIFEDITERKRAEGAVRRLAMIAKQAAEGIAVADLDGNIQFANDAWTVMHGYDSAEELVGESLSIFHTEKQLKTDVIPFNEQVKQRGHNAGEVGHMRKDGTTFPTMMTVALLKDEQDTPYGIAGFAQDITDRKWAAEALRQRTHDLGERVKELNCLYDVSKLMAESHRPLQEVLQGIVRLVPAAWQYPDMTCARITLDGQEVRTDNFRETAWGHSCKFSVAGREGGVLEVHYLQERPTRHDGPFLEEESHLIATLARETGRFVERSRAEEQLQRYAADLEERNEEVQHFAYVVSHDLRAPLVNLKGFATELRAAMTDVDAAVDSALPHLKEEDRKAVMTALREDIPEALDFIGSSVSRMDEFINALLKLSRLGRRELTIEPLDMNALVQTTVKTLAHQIAARQATVSVQSLPQVIADETSMEQIMGNLLNNAVLYLDPSRQGEISVEGERNGNEAIFRVRDNGRGIAAADMEKVFAPFRRAGRQDVPGEGMGLAYVQKLVHRHGGRIRCESKLDVGTTFSFTISNHPRKGDNHE